MGAPLGGRDATEVPLRDVPVGPSRHLVRFVETDGRRWTLKELPQGVAAREYAVLRELEPMHVERMHAGQDGPRSGAPGEGTG